MSNIRFILGSIMIHTLSILLLCSICFGAPVDQGSGSEMGTDSGMAAPPMGSGFDLVLDSGYGSEIFFESSGSEIQHGGKP